MAVIADRNPSRRATALLALGLMTNLTPIATFAAVLPEVSAAWGLSASQAGWIGGIYFGGYAAAVPVLASLTDRIDGRWVFAASSLLGAAASLFFAADTGGFWAALGLRLLGGVALAGVHMPGLKLLTERTHGRSRARGSAVYSACYSLGAAASFFLAGAVDAEFGWRAAFALSGLVPLVAIAALVSLPPASQPAATATFTLDLRPLLRNRALMAYVLAFAGNIWEVSAVRAWFVAYLSWNLGLPHHHLEVPTPAVISGLASLVGFPASIVIAEGALSWGPRAIVATCASSVLITPALPAAQASSFFPCSSSLKSPALPTPLPWRLALSPRPIRHAAVRPSRCSPLSAIPRRSSAPSRSVLPSTPSVPTRSGGVRPSSQWLSARPEPGWRCGFCEEGGRVN